MVHGNYAAYGIFGHNNFTNTIDAMSSDGSVRRPRIRTDSVRNRRRQNDTACANISPTTRHILRISSQSPLHNTPRYDPGGYLGPLVVRVQDRYFFRL